MTSWLLPLAAVMVVLVLAPAQSYYYGQASYYSQSYYYSQAYYYGQGGYYAQGGYGAPGCSVSVDDNAITYGSNTTLRWNSVSDPSRLRLCGLGGERRIG